MPKGTPNAVNGQLQATILKKCDRAYHRPGTKKQCAGGTCQHTCETAATGTCRHAWTVRYSVSGTQREKSFRDEMDDRYTDPKLATAPRLTQQTWRRKTPGQTATPDQGPVR